MKGFIHWGSQPACPLRVVWGVVLALAITLPSVQSPGGKNPLYTAFTGVLVLDPCVPSGGAALDHTGAFHARCGVFLVFERCSWGQAVEYRVLKPPSF